MAYYPPIMGLKFRVIRLLFNLETPGLGGGVPKLRDPNIDPLIRQSYSVDPQSATSFGKPRFRRLG